MITVELMERLFPTKGFDPAKNNLVRQRTRLVSALNKFLPLYKIDNYLRICAFFSCTGVETAYYRTTSEYASGADYDTRTDLGNTPQRDGDGQMYRGSGLMQTTGLYNFWRFLVRLVKKRTGRDFGADAARYRNFAAYTKSKEYLALLAEADRLGVNIIKNPNLLRTNIEFAVEAACVFWEENDLSYYADRKLIRQLNGIVNRGDKDKTPLHWKERNELYSRCIRYVPKNILLATAAAEHKEEEQKSNPDVNSVKENNSQSHTTDVQPNPDVVPDTVSPAPDSFLADAFDKNVSSDEVKAAAKTHAPRLLVKLTRPFALLYAALEAGNVFAWLGVIVAGLGVGLMIYWHRADIKKLFDKLKSKFVA